MAMHTRARDFVESWIEENIQSEPYLSDEADDPRPAEYAARCISDAEAAGISDKEIEGACDDLVGRMAEAIDASADAEVCRMIAKDPD